jgi:hypothetical protein
VKNQSHEDGAGGRSRHDQRLGLLGVEPADPLSVAAAAMAMVAVALPSRFPSARRAAGLDPLAALRRE